MPGDVTFDRGLVLRKSRHLMRPGELLDATNVLPDELAALTVRPGHAPVGTPVTSGATIHSLHTAWTPSGTKVRYQAYTHSGNITLLRNFTTPLGVSSAATGGPFDFVDAKGYGENKTYTYFGNGDGNFRLKDDGTTVTRWGINPPAAAPAVLEIDSGGNLSAGTYFVKYVYVRKLGATVAHLGNASATSAGVEVDAGDQILVGTIHNPADPLDSDYDPQVTHVWVYRTPVNTPDVFQFDSEIAAAGSGPLLVTLNKADSALGGLIEDDNDRPPGLWSMALHYDHLVGVSGVDNILYVSKRFRLESFPVLNQLEVSSPGELLLMVRSYAGRLLVWTASRVYEVVGGTDEQFWQVVETTAPTGLDPTCRLSVARGLRGLYWKGHDGLYRWDGSQIQNITDDRLWPLFHGAGVADVGHVHLAVVTSANLTQPGGWAEGRYYWSHSTNGTSHTRTFVYDEQTDSFWIDTRGFDRFHYEQRDNLFVASQAHMVFHLGGSATDNGTAISWSMQTRDEDDGAPQSDKELVQLTTEINTVSANVLVAVMLDYGVSSVVVTSTLNTAGRQQVTQNTLTAVNNATPPRAKALGYRLTGSGAFRLYRLLPTVLTLPMTRRAFHVHPSDLGHRGEKQLVHFTLDTDLLASGTLTAEVFGDGASLGTLQRTATGRPVPASLYELGEATLIELAIQSTADFRLWTATFGVVALPPRRRAFRMQPSTLGYRGAKEIIRTKLDVELLEAGTLTATLLGDGAVLETLTHDAVGRGPTHFVSSGGEAELVEVRLDSTADFRVWYADVTFLPLPEAGYFHHMQPTDLGWPSMKVGSWLDLDVELLEAGTLTADLQVDGVSRYVSRQTTVGRRRTGRLRLPREAAGRLVEIDFTSTARFRWWGGEVAFIPLGKTAGVQRVSLRSAAAAGQQVEVLQAYPSQEIRIVDVGRQAA